MSWGLTPISCIRPRTKGVHACSGVFLPLLWAGVYSPPPPPLLLHALCWDRTLIGGVPPLRWPGMGLPPSSSACRALGAHAAWGVPRWPPRGSPPPPPLHAVRWELTLLRGCPLLLLLVWVFHPLPLWHAVHWERTLPFGGGPPLPPASACAQWVRAACPPPPPARPRVARTAGAGGPLLRPGTGRTVESCADLFEGPPLAPAARCGRALLCGGFPPSFPPLAAALIKRAHPFGGSPRLVISYVVSSRREQVLRDCVPLLLRFRPPPVFRGPMAVLATGGP